MKSILLSLWVYLSIIASIESFEVPARNAAYCAYVADKIVCYGGSPNDENYNYKVYSLDLHNVDTSSVNELLNKWEEVPVDTNSEIATEYRYDSGFVALPNGIEILFEGGSNDRNYSIVEKTVTYNARDNTWSSLPDFYDPLNFKYRQISAQASVYMPNIDSIGFYGGKEFQATLDSSYLTYTGEILPEGLTYSYASKRNPGFRQVESYVGYYYMTLLNLKTNSWSQVTTEPPKLNGLLYLTRFQTATFHPRTNKVYYIGGLYKSPGISGSPAIPLSYAITYDTVTTQWDNQTLNPTIDGHIPAPRHLHTATMLNTNEDILIYGGTTLPEEDKAITLMDYIYVLNLETHTWTAHDILAPTGGFGPRYYHSAVLVNDTSLFILFGVTNGGFVTNNMLVLDVRNASSLSFSEKYPLYTPNDDGSVGLSVGAIAGIVVGAVIALLLIAAIIFRIRKKKRYSPEEKMEEFTTDWDQLEGDNIETSPTLSTSYNDSRGQKIAIPSPLQVPSYVNEHTAFNKPDVVTNKPDFADYPLKE